MGSDRMEQLCNFIPEERELMRLYCSGCPSAEALSRWFASLDFEALYTETACLAALTSAAVNYSGVPENRIPRLKGILKYVHTLNSGVISALLYLGQLFHQSGISMLLLGETAITIGFPQFPAFHLWKAEAGITGSDFPRALKIAESAGFEIIRQERCALIRRGNMQQLVLYVCRDEDVLSGNGQPVLIQDVPFLIPSREMLLLTFAEQYLEALKLPDATGRRIRLLMQIRHLYQNGTDVAALAELAAQRGEANQVRLALECLAFLLPGSIGAEAVSQLGTRQKTARLAETVLSLRKLPARGHRWKRLRLRIRIQTADRPLLFAPVFAGELVRIPFRMFSCPHK